MYTHMCIHIYTHIHTYAYIHTYIHTYICTYPTNTYIYIYHDEFVRLLAVVNELIGRHAAVVGLACMYIYIYIERERDVERERDILHRSYIYIYICVSCRRDWKQSGRTGDGESDATWCIFARRSFSRTGSSEARTESRAASLIVCVCCMLLFMLFVWYIKYAYSLYVCVDLFASLGHPIS